MITNQTQLVLANNVVVEDSTTEAFSSSAERLASTYEDNVVNLKESQSLGLIGRGTLDELYLTFNDRSENNWDGYGSKPVTLETTVIAKNFLLALSPGIEPPLISASPDGDIALDWSQGDRLSLTVLVSNDQQLHYAFTDGLKKQYGTELMTTIFPQGLSKLLNDIN